MRSRLGLFLVFLLVFTAGFGLYTSIRGVARASGPQIWLSQKVGPPTASVQAYGKGFSHGETVLVEFDTTQVGTATTDATGKFAVRVTVPKSALPGMHTVQATGQSSGLIAKTSFLVQTNWTQFRFGPNHKGANSFENVLTSSNVSALTLDWVYATGNTVYVDSSSPAIANGVVYIGTDDGNVYALDAVTGALRWSYTIGFAIGSSPAVANGMVYFGSYANYCAPKCSFGGKLFALDALTGALKWSYAWGNTPRNSSDSSPTVVNGVVYIDSDKLYALDALTGSLKWSYATGTSSAFSPAVANGIVYVDSDKLYALDAVIGSLKWSYSTTAGDVLTSSPAVANGVVYVHSSYPQYVAYSYNYLYALNARTGALNWSYYTGGFFSSSSVAVANGVVYVGSGDFDVFAFHLPGMS
jgi:outer membrane protein assembly factor BamB